MSAATRRATEENAFASASLADTIDDLVQRYSYIVIDTPGQDSELTRLAHAEADTLVTPLNDSFVDFDVLGAVDPETFAVAGSATMPKWSRSPSPALAARSRRDRLDRAAQPAVDARDPQQAPGGEAVQELAQRLNFRPVDGFAERMIYREFFPRGLTAFDDLDEATLGVRPTLSHATARQEVAALINTMALTTAKDTGEATETPEAAFVPYGSHLGCLTAGLGLPYALRPGDTLSRHCVRHVRNRFAFSLASALRSTTASAAGRPVLFGGFVATMAESDFSCPSIIGFGSSPSRCGPVGSAALWPAMRPLRFRRVPFRT